MQGLTLIIVFQAIKELALMEDPLITNYTKPVNPDDTSDLIPIKFSDYDNYILAFQLEGDIIPPEIGTIEAYIIVDRDLSKRIQIELKNCTEVLSKEII